MNPEQQRPKKSSKQLHAQQKMLQIWLPLGIVILITLGLFTLAGILAVRQSPMISQWADVSIILMLAPVMLLGTVQLLAIAFFIFLMKRSYDALPALSASIHLFILRIQLFVTKASNVVIKPVIGIRSATSAVKSIFLRKH